MATYLYIVYVIDIPALFNNCEMKNTSTFKVVVRQHLLASVEHAAGTGAILEIDLRVGVIPFKVTPRHVSLNIFLSVYSQRVQKPLFRT